LYKNQENTYQTHEGQNNEQHDPTKTSHQHWDHQNQTAIPQKRHTKTPERVFHQIRKTNQNKSEKEATRPPTPITTTSMNNHNHHDPYDDKRSGSCVEGGLIVDERYATTPAATWNGTTMTKHRHQTQLNTNRYGQHKTNKEETKKHTTKELGAQQQIHINREDQEAKHAHRFAFAKHQWITICTNLGAPRKAWTATVRTGT